MNGWTAIHSVTPFKNGIFTRYRLNIIVGHAAAAAINQMAKITPKTNFLLNLRMNWLGLIQFN